MSVGIALAELLAWNHESAVFWKGHLDANPALLHVPCGIGGTANVHEFAAHVWGVELRWAQRVAGLPLLGKGDVPTELEALFGLHQEAVEIFQTLLDDPRQDWDGVFTLDLDWLPPQARSFSHRKLVAHALFHSQRHWAQLATLVRAAGFPSEFKGDLLFSQALA